MRGIVLREAPRLGIPCELRDLTLEDVTRADEAWPLGENPRAYLDAERLVDVAVRAGCDA